MCYEGAAASSVTKYSETIENSEKNLQAFIEKQIMGGCGSNTVNYIILLSI